MTDEEPENWFGNVSLPLFPEKRQKVRPFGCDDGLSDLPS
jgi:hypothetical protein